MKISIRCVGLHIFYLIILIYITTIESKTSIEENFLGDLESHISARTATKSSLTRAVIDLLDPVINEQLFMEDGNTVTVIFENNGIETIQREQHDLIHAILHSVNGKSWLKFYLLRPIAIKALPASKLQKSSLNIFLVDGFESFSNIYERLREVSFENDAYYLVILNYLDEDWYKVAKKIFAKAWKRYMINTSLMFMSNTNDVVKIFTYFPYAESHCEQAEPVLIQQIEDGKWVNEETIFPKKLRNFHGCPIKVALFDVPPFIFLKDFQQRNGSVIQNLQGIEASLLKVLAVKYNFTIEPVMVDEWGYLTPSNRSTNGAVEALLTDRANMTIGIFAISANRNSGLKPGFPYHSSAFIFVIPPEPKLTSRLIRPLSETVRAAVFSTFCIGVGIIFIATHLHKRWRQLILGRDNHHPYCNMVQSALGGSLARIPFNNFARFCLISWILFCFVINNFYLAKYFQFLTQDDEISLANTFSKIAERKYTVYIRPTCKEFFDDHPELNALTQILPLSEYPKYERLMQDPATSAVLMHTFDFVLYKNKAIYRDKPLLMASQHIIDQQITIYYPNHSCLTHAFNPVLRELNSNGLIAYWVKQYIDPMFLVQKLKTGHDEKDLIITNDHLRDIYWVVIGGWIVAVFVFVMEVLSVRSQVLKRVLKVF